MTGNVYLCKTAHYSEVFIREIFPKNISPKVNAITRPEFELANDDAAIQHVR